MTMLRLPRWLAPLAVLLAGLTEPAGAQGGAETEYTLAAGDVVRVQVFQNPDLTLETRVSENGSITYPLIGNVKLGGLALNAAERQIAKQLADGGFVRNPQVTIVLTQNRGNQVSVLGHVNRPGRFPLETANIRLSEMIAIAGGIMPTGADVVIVTGTRQGKPMSRDIDLPGMFLKRDSAEDLVLAGGDVIYVQRAPMYYIYGEAQRPGSYRIERGMTVQQALAQGGGPTPRGSERTLRLHRRQADGQIVQISPEPTSLVQPDDVIYVRESIF
jgi:polysaccharide export outer membrane protein